MGKSLGQPSRSIRMLGARDSWCLPAIGGRSSRRTARRSQQNITISITRKKITAQAEHSLRPSESRTLFLRLFGGMALCVTTLYAGPKAREGKGRGKEGAGLYPELAILRFSKCDSPALASEVARSAALLPSFEITRKELERRGRSFDIKVVHRMALRVGQEVLTTRKRDLMRFIASELNKGTELAGKRIGIAVDGGRTRMREGIIPQKGRGKNKSKRRRWKSQWREPKNFIIFEIDEQGRMKEGSRSFIDGTTLGPDALMQLLAMRLYQLGAQDAQEIVFLADGGTWIWNRIDAVLKMAGINPQKVDFVLDIYHAIQHIQLAVEALGFQGDAGKRVFRRLRQQLYRGQNEKVTAELNTYFKTRKNIKKSVVKREINYFCKHATHMAYNRLREEGKPMGSGAIESTIRRVINQRLKGNGLMWKAENAEAIMVMRGVVLSDRWEETLEHSRASLATNRKIDWKWSAPDMRKEKIPDEVDHAKNTTKSFGSKGVTRKIA